MEPQLIMSSRKNHRKMVDPSKSASPCRALVWMDSTQLKTEEQTKCKKLHHKLENTRLSVELHESKSVPEFQKWMQDQFNEQLIQLRTLGQKFAELQPLVDAVQRQSFMQGIPQWKAYETIVKMRTREEELLRKKDEKRKEREKENPKGEPHPSESEFEDEFTGESQNKFEDKFEDDCENEAKEDFLRAAFEAVFGNKKKWRSRHQSYEEAYQEFKDEMLSEGENEDTRQRQHQSKSESSSSPKKPSPSQEATRSLVREQYRILAKRLHPDLNPNLGPKMLELWHQVQKAYEAQDLTRLETLTALSDLADPNSEKIGHISTLKNLFRELRAALSQLEKKIRAAKKDPSWKFHEKINQPQEILLFKKEMTRSLKVEEKSLRNQVDQLQDLVQEWANPSKKDHRRKKSRSSEMGGMDEIDEMLRFAGLFR